MRYVPQVSRAPRGLKFIAEVYDAASQDKPPVWRQGGFVSPTLAARAARQKAAELEGGAHAPPIPVV